ncbi:hypothetical protein CR513_01947, partial [Mucuna pruriens]
MCLNLLKWNRSFDAGMDLDGWELTSDLRSASGLESVSTLDRHPDKSQPWSRPCRVSSTRVDIRLLTIESTLWRRLHLVETHPASTGMTSSNWDEEFCLGQDDFLSKSLLNCIVNLACMYEISYENHEDKYINGELVKDYVSSLLVNPCPSINPSKRSYFTYK